MGFLDKIKAGIEKFKEENSGFLSAMKRINAKGFCGEVNRKVSNGDFWNGSYLSIEGEKGVIYGSNQENYFFTAEDIASFECNEDNKLLISKGQDKLPAYRCHIEFKDGKRAQADILVGMIDPFKTTFKL